MRNFAVFGAQGVDEGSVAATYPAVVIDGMTVRGAIVETPEPAFDPADPAQARHVLVRVDAFSCNFRDKGFMLRLQQAPADRFFVIGSEFCGTVLEVGSGVRSLRPGDRVIAQNHYTGYLRDEEGVPEGLPTNQGSKELQVFHEGKLARIPEEMGAEAGAAFSIGAQTTYGMMRRVDPRPGETVLVTSATSNTSLFVLAALMGRGVRVIATTTSRGFDDPLRALGAERIVHLGRGEGEGFAHSAELAEVLAEAGGADCVFDPYFDLHLERAVELMAPFGRYVTCGVLAQNPTIAREAGIRPMNAEHILSRMLLRNLTVAGNCIGVREDLVRAIEDHAAGRLACVVDSVFGGDQAAPFLERTFNDRERFGKVVFRYD